MKIVHYNHRGEITSVQSMDDLQYNEELRAHLGEEGILYLPSVFTSGVLDSQQYVLDSMIVDRPRIPATFEGNLLRGIPEGATIVIEGSEYVADGTDIELDFAYPGTYTIRATLWPYTDLELSYENIPQV